MYVILKNQEEILTKAIRKAGSERKLAKILGVVNSAIYYYKYKNRPLDRNTFYKMIKLLNWKRDETEKLILKELEKNWRQKIGGKNCYLIKTRNGTFEKNLIKMKKASSMMHKNLKKKMGKYYFLEQYKRFKKIGGYKLKTKRGEFVRNILEKKIADTLFQLNLNYQYEPCIQVDKRYYFPDFKIDNIIIECSMWRGFNKAIKLKKKIKDFEKANNRVFIVVPNDLKKFYKSIERYLINENDIFCMMCPR